jgi:hypothetical protein
MMRRAIFLLACFAVPCIYAQSGVDAFNRSGSIKVRVTSGKYSRCSPMWNSSPTTMIRL